MIRNILTVVMTNFKVNKNKSRIRNIHLKIIKKEKTNLIITNKTAINILKA